MFNVCSSIEYTPLTDAFLTCPIEPFCTGYTCKDDHIEAKGK